MKKTINYSGIPTLILIAALVFMPVSCSKESLKENPEADNSSQLIKISGEDANSGTKTILVDLATLWLGGSDKVGVYSNLATTSSGAPNSESFFPQTKGTPYLTMNTPYTASSTAFSSPFTGAMKWGTGSHNFYAYYPYSASSGYYPDIVPITLATAQTQSAGNSSAHISALDFMVATPMTGLTPGTAGQETTVDFRYNHVFTVLEFQIKRSAGSAKITKIKLTAPTTNLNLGTGSTINITAATPGAGVPYSIGSSVGTKEITLTITGGVTPTSEYATTPKIYMMILPGDFSAESMTIGIEYEGGTGTFINNVKTGKIFERGKKYVVQIDVPIDGSGNTYGTVTIGSQVWMAENLKTTKYNDVTNISNVTNSTTWASLTTGAYCYYNNNVGTDYGAIYGALYNWHAVNTAKLCPTGWSVPTDAQWTTLTDYLGSDAGGKLKEAGYSHWTSPNTGATNSSGFTALPGGYRNRIGGTFEYVGDYGTWWSSTEYNTNTAYTKSMYNYNSDAPSYYTFGKPSGYSVRCLKN